MKRVLISTLILSTLLFNAGEATAQNVIRKNIDNFNEIDDGVPQAGSCDGPDMMPLPLPCIGLFVDGFVTSDASNETGLNQQNVTGGTRGTTLTYNAAPTTDPAAAAGLIIDPNEADNAIGTLQIQNEQGVFSAANVLWDGEGMGLPDFDMSSYENQLAYYDNFVLGVYFIDVNTDLTFTVTNTLGETAQLVANPDRNVNGQTVQELFFSLSDPRWTNPGVFSTPIQSIALMFSSTSVSDLNIDYFELQKIIPEPSLVWGTVIAVGTGMLSTYRKRKLP